MNMRPLWKKKLVTAGWLALTAAGMVVLVAAATRKNHKECAGINVEITGAEDHFFVDEKEVAKLLNANGNLTGRSIETINLLVMEKRLENDKWINNAELFFDNNQLLQVVIEENEPVARIFTVGGYSYYIDSSCKKLPLSDRLSARVPMFTNFPSDRTRLGRVDSIMMVSLKDMALYINRVPFWKAQVAQIDINDNRELEMVPTVGNHTVLLGKADDFDEKFNRLFAFYQQVWTKVGLEKYDKIDVQYKGQVVATKRGSSASVVVDSAKAQRALDELMAKMDTNAAADLGTTAPKDNVVKKPLITTKEQADGIGNNKVEVKTEQPKTSVQKPATTKSPAPAKTRTAIQQGAPKGKVPKAVMKKKG